MNIKINKKKLKKFLPLKYQWNDIDYSWNDVPNHLEDEFIFKKVNDDKQNSSININLGDEKGIDKIEFKDSNSLIEMLYVLGNKDIDTVVLNTETNIIFLENLFGKDIKINQNEVFNIEENILINIKNINISVMDWADKDSVLREISNLDTNKINYDRIKEIGSKIEKQLWLDESFLLELEKTPNSLLVLKNIQSSNPIMKQLDFWKTLNKIDLTHYLVYSMSYDNHELNETKGMKVIDYYVKSGQFKKDFLGDRIIAESTVFQILNEYPKIVRDKEIINCVINKINNCVINKINNYSFKEIENVAVLNHYQVKDFKNKEEFINFYIDILPLIGNYYYTNIRHLNELLPKSLEEDQYLIKKFLSHKNLKNIKYDQQSVLVNSLFANIESEEEIFNFYVKEMPHIIETNLVPYAIARYKVTDQEKLDLLYEKKLYKILYEKNVDYFYNLEESEVEKVVPKFNRFLDACDTPKQWIENINIIQYNPKVIISYALMGKHKKEIKNLLKDENNCLILLKKEKDIFKFIDSKNITEKIAITYLGEIKNDYVRKINSRNSDAIELAIKEFNLQKIPKEFFMKTDFCIELIKDMPEYITLCHPLVIKSNKMKKTLIHNNIDLLNLKVEFKNIPKDIMELTKISKENGLTMKDFYDKLQIYTDVINSNITHKNVTKKNKL